MIEESKERSFIIFSLTNVTGSTLGPGGCNVGDAFVDLISTGLCFLEGIDSWETFSF